MVWFIFLFAPLIPIRSIEIRIKSAKRQDLKFEVLQKLPLAKSGRAILKTYLFSWIFFPLFFFLPVALAFREAQLMIGIPEKFHFILITFSIVWIAAVFWKMLDWEEDRWQK